MTDTHIQTPMFTLHLTCVQTHSHISGRFFYRTPRSASWYTHTSSCVLEICLMMTHTYTLPYPRLIALHNTYFSFTFTGALPLHACCVTHNWRTYFTSVRRVFLVETRSYCRLYCETSGRGVPVFQLYYYYIFNSQGFAQRDLFLRKY